MSRDKIKIIAAAITFVAVIVIGLGYTMLNNNSSSTDINTQNTQNIKNK